MPSLFDYSRDTLAFARKIEVIEHNAGTDTFSAKIGEMRF